LGRLCNIVHVLALVQKMRAWRHGGFSAHNAVRVRATDLPGRRKLAQYMLRAPFALEKMAYDADSGTVIYRSRMHKTLKRSFQVMSEADWLALNEATDGPFDKGRSY
jgi:hypothetical protein